MGYAIFLGHCVACKRVFGFNPLRVPSVSVNGWREPICQSCVARLNIKRKANGLAPIVPLPDAYEGCEESELP